MTKPLGYEPDPPDLFPNPSSIFVEGRVNVTGWTRERRNAFTQLTNFANFFGLHVHETEIDEVPRRKSWSYRRVDLDFAIAAIKDEPGILFDDWAKLWEAGGQPTRANAAHARKKAMVALSRLFRDYRVEKVRREPDGRLTLWLPGTAPKPIPENNSAPP